MKTISWQSYFSIVRNLYMQARPFSVKNIFGQEKRFVVPLFQRPYVWEEAKQWQPLWEDLRSLAEKLVVGEEPRPHFLGAIVLDQIAQQTGAMEMRLVIDGQQRLTTLQIFLEAFCDLAGSLKAERYQRALEKLTRNDDPMSDDEDEVFKVWPTNVDQEHFRRVMQCRTADSLKQLYPVDKTGRTGHPIADGYLFFYEAISIWLDNEETRNARLDSLFNAVRDFVRLVVIDLEKDDDAQLIFETLNARGTPLLPSDLVKNFLFHRLSGKKAKIGKLYKDYWQQFDEDAAYWREELGRGHARRHRVDTFIQHLLTVLTGDEVAVSHLYLVFRDYAVSGPEPEVILESIAKYSQVYRSFDEFPSDSREGIFFRRLAAMDMTTAYPLLLELFSSYSQQRPLLLKIIGDIESFLVRRMVCQLNTRGYNRLFLDLLKSLKSNPTNPRDAVRDQLLAGQTDSNRWPSDEEFQDAWLSSPIYLSFTKVRIRLLLEAIEQQLRTEKSERDLIPQKLTIEHLMPQKWEAHWAIPNGSKVSTETRDVAIHTIGNLTLLTSALNPAISNSGWDVKKPQILCHTLLRINAELSKYIAWTDDAIVERGKELFQLGLQIWPR